MISYAQNFEDVMLRRVFRDRKDGFYIDVGAMDPVVESVTKFFYDEGWSGINIEPNDYFYRKLLEQRPRDMNLKLALGEREETRTMHMFEHIGNSTFEDDARDRYVERGFESKDEQVRVSTLTAICREFIKQEIDFLKIDCEGWEEAVIRGADWERFRPTVVVVEATAPGTPSPTWYAWEPYLIETAHYEMVYFDGLNRFYVRRESANLRRHFEAPPNFFDEFKTYQMQMTELERDALAARVAELEMTLKVKVDENLRLAAQSASDQCRLTELSKGCQELEQKLFNTRLWVGRLSQDLAASRRQSR